MKVNIPLFGAILLLVVLGGMFAWRINGDVIAEKVSPLNGGVIKVRAFQYDPVSLMGLFGSDDVIYRCEFYDRKGGPITSCQSYCGESFYPEKIEICWAKDGSSAWISLDPYVNFDLKDGMLSRSAQSDEGLGEIEPFSDKEIEQRIPQFAAKQGLDPEKARRILTETRDFVSEFNKTFSKPDFVEACRLTEPHTIRLLEAFAKDPKYGIEKKGCLPSWFYQVWIKGKKNDEDSLGLDADFLVDLWAVRIATSRIAEVYPDRLTVFLSSRLNTETSPLDAVLFQAIQDGLAERAHFEGRTGSEAVENLSGSEAMIKMALAQNPAYRHLAITYAGLISDTGREAFYSSLANDIDPQIKQTAQEKLKLIKSK